MTSTASDASAPAENLPTAGNISSGANGNGENGGAALVNASQQSGSAAVHPAQMQTQMQAQANSQHDPSADPQEDLFAQRLREHEAIRFQQWQEQVNKWRREATEDPQIGGANLSASVARAQLALDRFDEGKRIGQLLEQTGYGNNPDVLHFFNRLADALMEDGLVQGQPGGAMPPLEERMYAGWSSRSGSI